MQLLKDNPVDSHPRGDSCEPDIPQRAPRLRDSQSVMEPRDAGQPEGHVEAAHEALDAVLDEGR